MAVTRHFTIPVFIPELGCPHQCVFCNQRKISGSMRVPDTAEVEAIIESHLATIPQEHSHIEIGFFGGNFTGIHPTLQKQYLSLASRFLAPASSPLPIPSYPLQGIRISTRPNYIDEERLHLLKAYGVTTIELGAQSMDEEVLKRSGRGHSVQDTERASAMILRQGFNLGLQMMLGLPGDTLGKSLYTARRIVELGATNTRIYPTLVIRDTALADMYLRGDYQPLSSDEAIQWAAAAFRIFEQAGVTVIRMGLHPSEGLIDGADLLAGPYHPSFRELVETAIWEEQFHSLFSDESGGSLTIHVAPDQYNVAIGYCAGNRKRLRERFKTVNFVRDASLTGKQFYVDHH